MFLRHEAGVTSEMVLPCHSRLSFTINIYMKSLLKDRATLAYVASPNQAMVSSSPHAVVNPLPWTKVVSSEQSDCMLWTLPLRACLDVGILSLRLRVSYYRG